ncbi:hypothetical protein V3851_20380 [Paenibacillus sp. M1]|uniref:Thioredoxin domain-containing protein n=1 Tax=Paenibacillus haidiansis TaxID=1574488 RepID=A0ABU7VZ47_9BACL
MKNSPSTLGGIFALLKAKKQSPELVKTDPPRGGKVGDFLPLFKGRDQKGRKVKSEELPGRTVKLIFLSDSCASCAEVLRQLANTSFSTYFLVIKSEPEPYSDADLEDIRYPFSIIRSSRIIELFEIRRMPTIVTANASGMIERVDELAEPERLASLIER